MKFLMVLAALVFAVPAAGQDMSAFKTGPVFEGFGPHAPVDGMGEVPADTEFSIAFDVAKGASDGARNRGFESAARFINMHVAAGVDQDNIRLVVVVHGKASLDLISDAAWAARQPAGEEEEAPDNPSAAMVRAMMDAGVRFVLCGQSGTANGIAQADLIPGVETALSAMTAHAILQQRGYTVNPF
ncbi:DsrE family protein [Altererythrobacter sp. RZ02]|uniref:DsrE family protein n=1 Tax=Pontixanthobacter rizhaonensis TaxID=2730337 RepID=A0A848QF81_9SPHN|nr:DsrE family protein [Pontixanthobacter rizhaonensis]NMW32291.1 DsrE family protein [Pontixanthobacter rizhaonensis]